MSPACTGCFGPMSATPPEQRRSSPHIRAQHTHPPSSIICNNRLMTPTTRYLLDAKDVADARYSEHLTVADLARAAGMSRAHFSRQFREAFGEPPHQYLLTRRLERAAALLRNTDWAVTDICFAVGLTSVGSFVTSFRRVYGRSPAQYRDSFPPAQRHIRLPMCVARAYGRRQNRTFREADAPLDA